MLLVDHDQPQLFHRGEDGGTRAHHDPGLPRTDAPPFVISLAVGQAAVQYGGIFAEAAVKPAHHLGGQGDLRHQNNRAPAHFQRPLHHGQIDLRLAAAGHAVEQERALSPFQRGDHAVQRFPLVVGQRRRNGAGRFHLRIRGPEDLPLSQCHQPLLPQRFQRVPGIGHQLSQLADAVGLTVLQKPQHHGPLGRPAQRVRLFFRVHAGAKHGAEFLLHLNAPGTHGGGQHQPQGFGQRAVVFLRQLTGQRQKRRQQSGIIVQRRRYGPQFLQRYVGGQLIFLQKGHHKSVHPALSQRHADPGAPLHLHALGDAIGKGAVYVGMHHVHDDLCDHVRSPSPVFLQVS